MRYVQVRRFKWRGAVNGVPLSCSVYKPSGGCCGAFWPTGSAPGTASVANSLPKPELYCNVVVASAVVGISHLVSEDRAHGTATNFLCAPAHAQWLRTMP